MMQDLEFDPYGQRTTKPAARAPEHTRASSWLARAGSGLFWALVVMILAARIAYFVPAIAQSLDGVKGFAGGLLH